MKKTRFIVVGLIISLLLFSSATYAASNTNTTSAPDVTIAVMEGEESKTDQISEITATTAPEIPVPQESTTLVTKQNAPGAGWILLAMILLPLAIGIFIGWYLCKFVQKKKAEAYAADDIEDENEEQASNQAAWQTPAAPVVPVVPAVRQIVREQPRVSMQPQPMEAPRMTMQPARNPIPATPPPAYVPIAPVAPPVPKIPDPIPDQIDDWGRPYFYDDQGIPYYFDPDTHVRTYYVENETET